MSYLGPPRLHFSGRFQADTSTVNNFVRNYDSPLFVPDYDDPHVGGWNPYGTGSWRFVGCSVKTVCYRDGSLVADMGADPVIGMSIVDAGDRVPAKLVDLDPEQQLVSQIWGFELSLASSTHGVAFRGSFAVTPLADLWKRYRNTDSYDRGASAYFQSVLTGITWPAGLDSRVLREIAEAGSDPTRLSIRFTTDGYENRSDAADFTFGRVTGAIGPYIAGEPERFVAGRVLRPVPGSLLHYAQAQITDDLLVVDLSNSLPTAGPGGPPADLGELQLAILGKKGEPELLGPIPFRATRWCEDRAGVHWVKLTNAQLARAKRTPLAVLGPGSDGPRSVLLAEEPSGAVLRADDFVFRLNPGDTATATLYVRRFGEPAAATVELALNSQIANEQAPQAVPAGTPAAALAFPPTVEVDAAGQAEVQLRASAPGSPRRFMDGQVYGIGYQWKGRPGAAYSDGSASGVLNVLVWDEYTCPVEPTWRANVQPIFQQYANLYPAMKPIVDLSDYHSVVRNRHILELALGLPESDPNYMPAVRDLSAVKRRMILDWLAKPLFLSVPDVDTLKWALQQAITLELSTLPPYLCALYSIKPGCNVEVASIIRTVVTEEMQHMALACNLLNAIGGQPVLDRPEVVPRYPAALPAGLRPDLTVCLRRCSLDQIRTCFMSIEEPDDTLIDPARGSATVHHSLTIGWFYKEIEAALERLDNGTGLFTGDPARQLKGWSSIGDLVVVTDLSSAKAAIHDIVEQGEGTSPFNPVTASGELAHYYRFQEVVEGKRLVVHPDGSAYGFTGEPVPFDPAGVWPMNDDPAIDRLPERSRARALSEQFNRTYANLLGALNRVFNGHPDELDRAIGAMYSMGLTARRLMQMPSGLDDGTTAGPSFEPFHTDSI
jgi:hypothetical protein